MRNVFIFGQKAAIMKKRTSLLILFLLCFYAQTIALYAQVPLSAPANLKLELKNSNQSFLVLRYNPENRIGKTVHDTVEIKNGYFERNLNLSQPVYISILADGVYGTAYLAPSYNSFISIDVTRNKPNAYFTSSGDGEIANNYYSSLIESYKILPKIFAGKGMQNPVEEYVTKTKKYQQVRDSIFVTYTRHFAEQIKRDPYLIRFFKQEGDEVAYYGGKLLLNYARQMRDAGEAKSFLKNYVYPTGLQNDSVNNQSATSKKHFFQYLAWCNVYQGRSNDDSLEINKIGLYAYSLKQASNHFSGSTRTYLITDLLYFLTSNPQNYPPTYPSIPGLVDIYARFLDDKTVLLLKSIYKDKTKPDPNIYSENSVIADYKMKDAFGQEMYLSQKLSKVTVIDMWAAWCGNCIEAFDDFDKVKSQYTNDKQVTFLQLSVDEKETVWIKKAESLKLDKANSFWIPGALKSAFSTRFQIDFLPRYILVNNNRKVLKLYAPGPVSGKEKLVALIEEHRNK